MVFSYLYAMSEDYELSEDLMQETFYRAYKSQNDFKGECKLSTWLCKIAKNLFLDYKRKHNIKEMELNDEIAEVRTPSLTENINIKDIYTLIHGLGAPYTEVFMLRQNEGFSFKVIGEIFGKNENWARQIYYRARENLKRSLRKEDLL